MGQGRAKVMIQGFDFEPEQPELLRFLTWRVYATRERSPERAASGAWALAAELRAELEGGRFSLPPFGLEPTDAGACRRYRLVPVDREGREHWGWEGGEDLVLPGDLPQRLGLPLSFGAWLLYNLGLRGEIAYGSVTA